MSLRLYLLRHGQTELSREDTFCGSGLDPELTAEGLDMARQFAEVYRLTQWKGIFTSALKRTISTAQPLCDAIGMQSEPHAELNEIAYGSWEGHTFVGLQTRPGTHQQMVSWQSR